MSTINSDYEFIFTAADARRQRRQAGSSNISALSWSQIFNPSSYYNRSNINFGGRNGQSGINLSNTNSLTSNLSVNNNTQLPNYEEAIQQSLDPSTVNITPLARPTSIYEPLNQV